MGVFEHFPYTNFHNLNLDWILAKVKEVFAEAESLEQWRGTHEQEYQILAEKVEGLIHNLVDVISPWDSSIAYHVFSIVEYQGANYIAVQDVPVGVMITNTDYWQEANTVVEQINAMSVIVSNLERWKPYVTPEEYGAVGDGETDDTLAINNAIAGSLELKKPLVMVHTYLVNGLEISDDNVQIYCYGEIKYAGTGYAVTLHGWYNTLHVEQLTARNGSGLLVTPAGKSVYMADIKLGIVTAKDYGIKFKDYVDATDSTIRYGVLYDKLTCKRIRTDDSTGHCIDFESDYFIGEIDMNIELVDHGQWALYADGREGDGINSLRTDLFCIEGDMDCFYLKDVHASVFRGLRYSETTGTYGRNFVTLVGRTYWNIFDHTAAMRLSAINVSGISSGELRYNEFTMPIVNAANRAVAKGAKANSYGLKYEPGYDSVVTVRNTYDYTASTFQWMAPTIFTIGVANTATDHLVIRLGHEYAWDGINKISFILNGGSYRPEVLDTAGNTIFDFRTIGSESANNGIYELTFARSTDALQTVFITRPVLAGQVSNVPQ